MRRRYSSAPFADAVAELCVAAHERLLPPGAAFRQTVLAAVVARFQESGGEPRLALLSLGVGTKFLRGARGSHGPDVVCDMHAEVLARRSLIRVLLQAAGSGGRCPSGAGAAYPAILERKGDGWALRASVSLHLYTSSTPCGNSAIKRWVTGKRVTTEGLGRLDVPPPASGAVHVTAREAGQVSFSRKGGEIPSRPPPEAAAPPDGAWSAEAPSPDAGPLACSDKIAVWQCLGLQGAALSGLVGLVPLASVVAGRKCTVQTLDRACRGRVAGWALAAADARPPFAAGHAVAAASMLATGVQFDKAAMAADGGASFDAWDCLWWSADLEGGAGGGGAAWPDGAWGLGGAGHSRRLDGRTGLTPEGGPSGISRAGLGRLALAAGLADGSDGAGAWERMARRAEGYAAAKRSLQRFVLAQLDAAGGKPKRRRPDKRQRDRGRKEPSSVKP